jgi:TusA-related sulfurtransferase
MMNQDGSADQFLKTEPQEMEIMEYDLSGFVCPLPSMKASKIIDKLRIGETVRILLGDAESLESVARASKIRGLKTVFNKEGENRFILTISK